MKHERQNPLVKDLLVDREELKKDIEGVRIKFSEAFLAQGCSLISATNDTSIDQQNIVFTGKSAWDEVVLLGLPYLDVPKLARLTEDLQKQHSRLAEVETQLKSLGCDFHDETQRRGNPEAKAG